MAMQRPLPFGSMSVLENAVLGAMFGAGDGRIGEREARIRAADSLAFVGLAGRAEQPVSSLNLHQQRFLEMAKALAGRPKLLLLDEVMAGLNESELADSVAIVRNIRDELGTTILWVEHVMSAVIQLARALGLSRTTVQSRLARLERSGVIAGYVAVVSPERVGLGLSAYINVRLEKASETHKRNPMDQFKAAVQTWPEVVECVALTGEMDYLLQVVVEDMAHYSRFIMETLLKHPSVEDCRSSFVLERLKTGGAVAV